MGSPGTSWQRRCGQPAPRARSYGWGPRRPDRDPGHWGGRTRVRLQSCLRNRERRSRGALPRQLRLLRVAGERPPGAPQVPGRRARDVIAVSSSPDGTLGVRSPTLAQASSAGPVEPVRRLRGIGRERPRLPPGRLPPRQPWRPARSSRSRENMSLARLAAFLDRRRATGRRGFVLEGEAGIGKTALWRTAVVLARERGYRVLEAEPAEAELQPAFADSGICSARRTRTAGLPAPLRRAQPARQCSASPPSPRLSTAHAG